MKPPLPCYAVTLCVGAILLTLTTRFAYADNTSSPPPNGNGLNSYGALPSAQLAFDDKSRIGAGLTGAGGNGNAPIESIPPKILLSLGADYYAGQQHIYSMDFLVSDSLRSIDFGFHPFMGDSHGYGISFRYDPSRQKLAQALSKLYSDLDKPGNSKELQNLRTSDFNIVRTEFERNFIGDMKKHLHVRYSAILGFQHIMDDSQMANGDIANIGVTTSVLIPLNYSALHKPEEALSVKRRSQGITVLLSTQLLYISPTRLSNLNQSTLLRYGFALIWQDRVPSKYAVDDTVDPNKLSGRINRWIWQGGLEYLPKNGVDTGRSLNGFLRY